eukprot:1144200-Pelagomonas_calceolata.AAC.2
MQGPHNALYRYKNTNLTSEPALGPHGPASMQRPHNTEGKKAQTSRLNQRLDLMGLHQCRDLIIQRIKRHGTQMTKPTLLPHVPVQMQGPHVTEGGARGSILLWRGKASSALEVEAATLVAKTFAEAAAGAPIHDIKASVCLLLK